MKRVFTLLLFMGVVAPSAIEPKFRNYTKIAALLDEYRCSSKVGFGSTGQLMLFRAQIETIECLPGLCAEEYETRLISNLEFDVCKAKRIKKLAWERRF